MMVWQFCRWILTLRYSLMTVLTVWCQNLTVRCQNLTDWCQNVTDQCQILTKLSHFDSLLSKFDSSMSKFDSLMSKLDRSMSKFDSLKLKFDNSLSKWVLFNYTVIGFLDFNVLVQMLYVYVQVTRSLAGARIKCTIELLYTQNSVQHRLFCRLVVCRNCPA